MVVLLDSSHMWECAGSERAGKKHNSFFFFPASYRQASLNRKEKIKIFMVYFQISKWKMFKPLRIQWSQPQKYITVFEPILNNYYQTSFQIAYFSQYTSIQHTQKQCSYCAMHFNMSSVVTYLAGSDICFSTATSLSSTTFLTQNRPQRHATTL